jgi:hypothetical protein
MTLNELSVSSTTASASPKAAQPRVTHRCPDLVLRYPFAPQGLLQEFPLASRTRCIATRMVSSRRSRQCVRTWVVQCTEMSRADLGLPLPRQPVYSQWYGHRRPGAGTVSQGHVGKIISLFFGSAYLILSCPDLSLITIYCLPCCG